MKKILVLLLIPAAINLGCQAQAPVGLFREAPSSPFTVGQQPADVVLGDVNNDGHADIITANTGSNDVTVLLGDGTGAFASAPGPAIPAEAPHLVIPGDLNRDGNLDLVLTSHDSNDVMVLLGKGDGRFRPAPASPYAALHRTPPHNHGLALGDANGDGNLDIVTANQNDSSVSVLLGNGDGNFQPTRRSPFAVGRWPYLLALGDVNRDGHLDIATPNARDDTVTLLLGNGTGRFSPAPNSPIAVNRWPYSLTIGDINGDGNPDILTSHNDSTLLSILLGDGKGMFEETPNSPIDIGRRGWRIRLGDVNGDGKTDLVTDTAGNSVVVLLGDGEGGFKPAPGSPFATGQGPWGIALGDVDGDGKLDIVTANSNSNDVTVLLGN